MELELEQEVSKPATARTNSGLMKFLMRKTLKNMHKDKLIKERSKGWTTKWAKKMPRRCVEKVD
jgi:hypothetical protein